MEENILISVEILKSTETKRQWLSSYGTDVPKITHTYRTPSGTIPRGYTKPVPSRRPDVRSYTKTIPLQRLDTQTLTSFEGMVLKFRTTFWIATSENCPRPFLDLFRGNVQNTQA